MLSGRHGDTNGVTTALNNLKATAPNRMSADMLRQLTDDDLMQLVTQAVIAREVNIPRKSPMSPIAAQLSGICMPENDLNIITSQYTELDEESNQALIISAGGSLGTFDEDVSKLDEQDELELGRKSWADMFGEAQAQTDQNEGAGVEEDRLMLDTDDAIETISSATSDDDMEEEPQSSVADPSLVSLEMSCGPLVRRDRKRIENTEPVRTTIGESLQEPVSSHMMNIGMIGVPTAAAQISELKQKLKESASANESLRYRLHLCTHLFACMYA
jgi:hypothetical protein